MSKLTERNEPSYFNVSDYKPIITIAGDSKLFKSLEGMLSKALPQERAEWRRSYGRITKEIQLSAVFVPFANGVLQKVDDYHLLQQPILHIFWTQCPDVETYKNIYYDEIKLWLQVLQSHEITDWLIVLVETEESRKYNKLLPRATVLDKIKNDFGVKHMDRCLSLNNPLKAEFRAGSSWRTLLVNIRLLILTSYDKALVAYESYVRTQRESRNQTDWSFCDYFLLQEELSFVLEMLGLYEEALIQYDELEALFTQFIRNSSLAGAPKWLSYFQAPTDGWSAIALTNKVNRRYRDAIQNHSIALLDFRCYLFCRQSALLALTSKPWEIAQRTLPFIHNCLNEIRILELSYPVGAIASWIFVCCLEIIYVCQGVNDNAKADACSLYTAPLMELAIFKLHELGDLCGLMPNCDQISEQLHIIVGLSAGIGDPPRTNRMAAACPVDKLKEAVSSKDAYCKIYLELCEQAVIAYKHRKRIRSARFIEKQLAEFFTRIRDLQKAAQFLANPLISYEADDWPELANQIRLQLLTCYKQTNEMEKLLRTSISVASSSYFDMKTRISSFDDVCRILEENNSSNIVLLDESFSVESIEVQIEQVHLQVRAVVQIISKLPCEIECSSILVSVHNCSKSVHNCSNRDVKDEHGSRKEQVLTFRKKLFDNIPTELPLVSILNYQQDKSLAGVTVFCKSHDSFLKRKPSQNLMKPLLPAKQNISNNLSSESVRLKSGLNFVSLHSKNDPSFGSFHLGQLCIHMFDNLIFLSPEDAYSSIKYSIEHVPPKISLISSDHDRTFISGLRHYSNLHIDLGTYILNEDTVLLLRTSESLKICLSDGQTLENELKINLSRYHVSNSNNLCIPLVLCSSLVWQTEAVTEHDIWLTCPWSDEEVSLMIQSFAPFVLLRQIHSIKLRKFLQISVTGSSSETILFKDPELSAITKNITTTSLNPSSAQPFVINNSSKIKFMWELTSPIDFPEKCALEFSMNYSIFDEIAPYKYTFEISNFSTLYTVESKVDPLRGSECCRVKSMCQFHFTVEKVASTSEHSLKYEVICDQTMWAVCNASSGVLIMDETDKCSLSVNVMPLTSGYLPLPIIKLSKYFAAESNIGCSLKMSPRYESFCQGQVFNLNKATQIQVLPAVNISEL